MHRSRLAGFIIDCQNAELDPASQFWSAALGMSPGERDGKYVDIEAPGRDLHIEVQRVAHESRLHLDIESDDIDAEAARLEGLGAKRIDKVNTWWVMEAPTGHRFCVVRAKKSLEGAAGATAWK
jgi:Glyoxalase-like domain